MEVAGIEVLNGLTPENAKSTKNFHTIVLYIGKEEYETLQAELQNLINKFNDMNERGLLYFSWGNDLHIFLCDRNHHSECRW